MTAVTIRQFASASASSSVTFGSAPLLGSLLIAMTCSWTQPTAGSGWTKYQESLPANTGYDIFYKVCGSGESTTQTPSTSNTAMWLLGMWEITGQNVRPDLAIQSFKAATAVTLTSNAYTTTATTTTQNDTVMLAMFAGGTPTSTTQQAPAVTSGQSDDAAIVNNTFTSRHYGATFSHRTYTTSGTTVQYTVDFSPTTQPSNDGVYFILLLNPAYTPTGNWVSSTGVEVMNTGVSTARVSSLGVEVLRSITESTTQDAVPKLTPYAVLQTILDDKVQAPMLNTYSVLSQIPVTAASMINTYTVLLGTATVVTKEVLYVPLQVNLSVTDLTGYVVLKRAPPNKRRVVFFGGGD